MIPPVTDQSPFSVCVLNYLSGCYTIDSSQLSMLPYSINKKVSDITEAAATKLSPFVVTLRRVFKQLQRWWISLQPTTLSEIKRNHLQVQKLMPCSEGTAPKYAK